MAESCVDDQARIVCSICLEDFVKPKLLPCFHTFCLLCLESYIEKVQGQDKFDCPLCRVITEIPKGGVSKFQTNFYIQSTSRKTNGDLTCDVCEDKTAANTCIDCDENLCTECTKYHQRMRATREHKLCELTQEKGGTTRKIKTRYFCKHHPKDEIKMVCIDCDTELCLVCKLTDHENHSTKDVKNMAIDRRKEIGVMVEKVNGDMKKIDAMVETVKQKLTHAKKLKDENMNTLEDQTKLYVQKVYENKDKMKELIDKSYEEDTSRLNVFLNDLEHAQTHTKQLALIAKNIEETADDVAVISLGAQFKQKLGEVEKLDPDVHGKLSPKQLKFTRTEVPEVTIGVFKKETPQKEDTEVRPRDAVPKVTHSDVGNVIACQLLNMFPRNGNFIKRWVVKHQFPLCETDSFVDCLEKSDYFSSFPFVTGFPKTETICVINKMILSINVDDLYNDFILQIGTEGYVNEKKARLFLNRLSEVVEDTISNYGMQIYLARRARIKLLWFFCSKFIKMGNIVPMTMISFE